jgi:uncharacterized protein YbjT (DUF2867 family)
MKCVVLGATGRTGAAAARWLVATGASVIVHGNTRQPVVDGAASTIMGPLSSLGPEGFAGANALLICVGKQNPNRQGTVGLDEQEQLEVSDTAKVAVLAKSCGVQLCILLSAYGAKKGTARYSNTKALAEKALEQVGFAHLLIAQPGFILGGGRGPGKAMGRCLKGMGIAIECESLGRAMALKTLEANAQLDGASAAVAQGRVTRVGPGQAGTVTPGVCSAGPSI